MSKVKNPNGGLFLALVLLVILFGVSIYKIRLHHLAETNTCAKQGGELISGKCISKEAILK